MKTKCKRFNHYFTGSTRERHGQTISLRIDGDAFIEDVKCIICGTKAEKLYSNKHPDFINPITDISI